MKEKILVVDDEKDILELIEFNLLNTGYKVTTATTGEEALALIRNDEFDLVILDIMLPGMDGLDICKIIKADKNVSHLPVIMVTAKTEEVDRVTGFEIGADHYVTKPFSPRELMAIVKSVFRRKSVNGEQENQVIKFENLLIHPGKYEVLVKGKSVELTNLEFKILVALARRPGWVMTRYQIVDAARGEGGFVTDRTVDVHIASLRKKLGERNNFIETVRGVGYKFRGN